MCDEIKGDGFVMRQNPEAKKRTSEEYARAWLTGQLEADTLGYKLPALRDVMAILHKEPQLAQPYIKNNVDVRLYHDFPIIEESEDGYDVYLTDHGKKIDLVHFNNVWSALELYWQYRGLK